MGAIRVIRISSAHDAGEIVPHDGVRNQIEGSIVQSLSWTLKEAVRFDPRSVRFREGPFLPSRIKDRLRA